MQNKDTDFGFTLVTKNVKQQLVNHVFSNVSQKYDLMNDIMSWGLHRLWKRKLANIIATFHKKHHVSILDLASGTGDVIIAIKQLMQQRADIIASDINKDMLSAGSSKLINNGYIIPTCLCNAEELPFANNQFDAITIAFGLRNVTNKEQSMREMYRTIKPGGCAYIMEFSRPAFEALYDKYLLHVLPCLGKYIAKDETSYRYLGESIKMHPDQPALRKMMLENGFDKVEYRNLNGGIVAIHFGYKY